MIQMISLSCCWKVALVAVTFVASFSQGGSLVLHQLDI